MELPVWLSAELTTRRGRWLSALVWILVALLAWTSGLYREARELTFDKMQVLHWHLFGRDSSDQPNVWVIAIDDASIAVAGSWPYPRVDLADLIDRAANEGAAVLGLDIFLLDSSTDPLADVNLIGAVGLAGNLVLAHTLAESAPEFAEAQSLLSIEINNGSETFVDQLLPSSWILAPNFGVVDEFAAGHGFINDDWIHDRLLRRIPAFVRHEQFIYPALALEMIRVYAGADRYDVRTHDGGLRTIDLKRQRELIRLHVDDQAIFRPRLRPSDESRIISALNFRENPTSYPISGDIVLIGVTALGVDDTAWTAFGEVPGVEIHAQIVESILAGDGWQRPVYTAYVEVVLGVLAMVVMLVLVPAMTMLQAFFLLAGLSLAVLVMTMTVMEIGQLLIDPLAMIGSAATVVLTLHGLRLIVERQRRQAVEKARLALETQLEVARDIQNSILVRPDRVDGLPNSIKIDAKLVQSNFVGGDFFDLFMIDDQHLFMIVADVSGKGWPSAFFMAIAKAFIQSCAMAGHRSPAEIASRAEREIMRNNPQDLFVTAILSILNVRTGVLKVCNAGHPPPILIGEGRAASSLSTIDAPPIGMVPGFEFQSSQHQLQNGDTLLLFTDGLADLTDKGCGDSMGDLRQFIDRQRDGRTGMLSAATMVEHAVGQHSHAEDDITLLMARFG